MLYVLAFLAENSKSEDRTCFAKIPSSDFLKFPVIWMFPVGQFFRYFGFCICGADYFCGVWNGE